LCRAVALALGEQYISHSSDLVLAFGLAFDHLFEFFSRFFSFSLFSELVIVCVVNALIKGEIEDRNVRGPVDGRSWP
jgi:hypothetical protein